MPVKTRKSIKIKREIDTSTFAGRLMFIRGRVSQPKFAKFLGVSHASVIRYETGERIPDLTFIQTIIAKCNVNPSWLIIGEFSGPGSLSERENKLLENYNACPEEAKRMMDYSCAIFAEHEVNRLLLPVNPAKQHESEPS